MTAANPPPTAAARRLRGRTAAVYGLGAAAAVSAGTVVAALVAEGYVDVALALLAAGPLAYLVLRHPVSVVALWLLVTPFLMATEGGSPRKVFWLVHRTLPLVALTIVVAGALLRAHPRRLPRLGLAELAMAGYLVVSLLSIVTTSDAVSSTTIALYDRVAIPMALYLLVRLLQPDGRDLRRVLPVVLFLLLSQTLFGLLSWIAPDVLPSAWLGRVGLRTTGSLRHPNVYGTTLLFAGLLVLHHALSAPSGRHRLLRLGFPVAMTMVFLSYSRASWVAAAVVLLGVAFLYPRYAAGVVVTAAMVVALLLSSGLVSQQVTMARNRLHSEQSAQSALSRLPVVYASLRMFQLNPLQGWGFGNFDQVSPSFQGSVGAVIVPDREHASHNLYLTILAEQGLVGLGLYLAPALLLLRASRSAWRNLPADGLVSRKLLAVLWLVPSAHVVVNNYSNMRVVFGLGTWWLTLGMIASLVARYGSGQGGDAAAPPAGSLLPATGLAGPRPGEARA